MDFKISIFLVLVILVVFAVLSSASGTFNYVEPASHYDIATLEDLCNSTQEFWSFSASDEQRPLLSGENVPECIHRLRHNRFIWTPYDLLEPTTNSSDHLLITKTSQLSLLSLDKVNESEPIFEPDQDFLIELSKKDQLERKINIVRKKLLLTEIIDERTLRFGKAHKREVCFDFSGPAKAALRRDHGMHYDLCIKDIRGSFEELRRTMPLNPGKVQKILLKWSADLDIQLKSGTKETTLTIPVHIYDCTMSYDGRTETFEHLIKATTIPYSERSEASGTAILSLPILLISLVIRQFLTMTYNKV
ncbi:hypothetical protein DMENIID0001_154780 [Sergentomyia squamirostris]